MQQNLNTSTIADEIQARLPALEYASGKNSLAPFGASNSGSRKIMQIVQAEQRMQLMKSELATITTGAENQFGEYSSSFIRSDANYTVIDKIPKYSNNGITQSSNYWLILVDNETGMLHTIERIDYQHIVESYGYRYDNTYMDSLEIGECIPKDIPIKKSASFDTANNKCDGLNLTTIYMATALTTEDPIVISQDAANKFGAPLFKPIKPVINDNDILLNLYGDSDNYKTFPDIGEDVKEGVVCAVRRECNDEALYSQSWERLKHLMISDDRFTAKGQVIDINVYCNNPDKLQSSLYNGQIAKYYNMQIEFCTRVINCVDPLLKTGLKMTHDMQELYYTCKDILNGKQWINDGKVFNNIILQIVVMEILPLEEGDKITDRYGGKGVISRVLPTHLMVHYKINNRWEPVDVQYNSNTVVNRENPGQLKECSITFIGKKILEYIFENSENMKLSDAEDMIYRYMAILSPTSALYYHNTISKMTIEERTAYMQSIMYDNRIHMTLKPISEDVTLDTIDKLYKEFPWIKMSEIRTSILGSNNEWRYITARRRLVTGEKYIYRLKQFAEEKFSAVSLASTNIRSENTKSRANKLYKITHAQTPVRFGEMELENLLHTKVENVIQVIMLLSTSPLARRLHKELLVGNPFDIDIKLDKDSVSRSVEIVNAYLKTAGLRLVFDKIPKPKGNTVLRNVVSRIPGGRDITTDVVSRIPGFIKSIEDIKELVAKHRRAIAKSITVVTRVPDNMKNISLEEARLYEQKKEFFEGVTAMIDLVDDEVTTKQELEKRIETGFKPEKMQRVVSRRVVSRIVETFPKK